MDWEDWLCFELEVEVRAGFLRRVYIQTGPHRDVPHPDSLCNTAQYELELISDVQTS
jgi:hypothetical protein